MSTVNVKYLKDESGNKISPIVSTDSVYNGSTKLTGDYIKGLSVSGRTVTYTKGDGTTGTITTQDNNTWTAFKGATSSAAGTAGYVPAPSKGDQAKFFRADGTWQTVSSGTTYSAGTGISISSNTITNSGVRSISESTVAGCISVNTNGTSKNVEVFGLGTAAYAATSDFAASSHTHSYLPLSGGTVTGTITLKGGSSSYTNAISTSSSNGNFIVTLGTGKCLNINTTNPRQYNYI